MSVPKIEFERAIDPQFARDELARMRAVTAGASSLRLLEFAIREKFANRIAVISSFAANPSSFCTRFH